MAVLSGSLLGALGNMELELKGGMYVFGYAVVAKSEDTYFFLFVCT